MATERIQKLLAQAGLASRRKAEQLIELGEVTVNGKVAKLGDKAEWGKDAIKVSGKLVTLKEPLTYVAFFKPKSVVCSLEDPQGRPCIKPYISRLRARVYPVGRLDFNSEGLILLTNDGDFAEKLQKSQEIVRVYRAKVKGHVTPEVLERVKRGGRVEGKLITPYEVRTSAELASKSIIEIALTGAVGVDLKTFLENKGLLVERMTRTAIGQIGLSTLKPGEYRFLQGPQIEAMLKQPELGLRRVDYYKEKEEGKLTERKREEVRRERAERGEKRREQEILSGRKVMAEQRKWGTQGASSRGKRGVRVIRKGDK